MPRRHRRAPQPGQEIDNTSVRRGVQSIVAGRDGDWMVRTVPGDTGKVYRCPGCDQEIPAGVPHVVAWPADERGDLRDRRHWHTGCWRARDRRAPVVARSRSAPRYG